MAKATRPVRSQASDSNVLFDVMVAHVGALCALCPPDRPVEVKLRPWRGGSCFSVRNPAKYSLVFGEVGMGEWAANGFCEYATLTHLLPKHPVVGGMAIFYLVTHEAAHLVHWLRSRHANLREKPHGPEYAAIYHELLQAQPYAPLAKAYAAGVAAKWGDFGLGYLKLVEVRPIRRGRTVHRTQIVPS